MVPVSDRILLLKDQKARTGVRGRCETLQESTPSLSSGSNLEPAKNEEVTGTYCPEGVLYAAGKYQINGFRDTD